ncbi:leader peptidase (prepilin peptidase)/N-methyltransferase [Enterococcus sp. DIV0212c]|uniref:prepilin peptidase n=1 Tax=Enterococcus sp. DIV0212c TaxID=2230867 RepID=UPI001A9AE954|nr:A24 family peptidase [Enterococcus sp. DIV0212c]MBO1353748.1 prepilin peptidase [Enterococcus sp. DIV0212c]
MLVIYFVVGCVIGSFLCLAAERIPIGKSILFPASHCSYCRNKLKFFELIPIISIIFLRFRCRYCGHRFSPVYFFSELICGWLCFLTIFKPVHSLYWLCFLFTAVLLSLTDIFYLIVEPKIFYPLAVLLCIWHIYLPLPIYLLTSIISFLGLHGINYFFPDSVGGGDIILLTLWGALLGSESLILLLFCASSSGLFFILFCQYVLKKSIRQLPFVPFLSIGLFIVFLCK